MTKWTAGQKISARILKRMTEGKSLEEAFDAVLGAGAYRVLANDIYTILRGEA